MGFAAMGAKLIGVSCDSVDSHNAWAKDVVARATPDKPDDDLAFPIIGDADKSLVTRLGMLDPAEKDKDGDSMPARVLVILHGNVVKLTILYPATTGRNFEEVKRVLTSLKLTVDNGFATPVDWKAGDAVVVTPGYAGKYPDTPIGGDDGNDAEDLPSTKEGGMRVGAPYLKTVPYAYVEGLGAAAEAAPVPRSENVVDEVKRVLNSLQMTMVDGFATPVNWNVTAADNAVFVTPGYASKHPDAPIAEVAGYEEEQLPSTAEGGARAGKPYIKTVPYAYVATLK